jgi:hypothetical protein
METIDFNRPGQYLVNIGIPENWNYTIERGTRVPFTAISDNVKFVPPQDEKASLQITIGRQRDGKALNDDQFNELVDTRLKNLYDHEWPLEKEAKFFEVKIKGGTAMYSIFTNKSLVNKIPAANEYMYRLEYFANYKNGCIAYGIAQFDIQNGENFKLMLESLSTIDPFLP